MMLEKEIQTADTINRQAAIDALNDEFTITGKTNAVIVQDYIRRVNIRLHDLPSAEPEQKWIPCKERQPEEDGAYLVTLIYISNKGIEHRYTSIQEFKYGIWIMFGSCRIEAWMPLPEPPKEE